MPFDSRYSTISSAGDQRRSDSVARISFPSSSRMDTVNSGSMVEWLTVTSSQKPGRSSQSGNVGANMTPSPAPSCHLSSRARISRGSSGVVVTAALRSSSRVSHRSNAVHEILRVAETARHSLVLLVFDYHPLAIQAIQLHGKRIGAGGKFELLRRRSGNRAQLHLAFPRLAEPSPLRNLLEVTGPLARRIRVRQRDTDPR